MAKTYEQKMRVYRNTCINHSQLTTLYVKYQINSERPYEAGILAKTSASWAFMAMPELRDSGVSE
jgi:hypothetical protein